MSKNSNKRIFFHVGLGKTASTYLQEKVFPYFKDIEYIHRLYRYKKAINIIARSKSGRILVSREFDHQFEQELKQFSAHYPDTTVIIVFRRQDSWIASQYRRFFKNGLFIPFSEFVDLKGNKGVFNKSDLDYYRYLNLIEKYFTKKPIVLIYDDLRKDPLAFIGNLAGQIGVEYNEKNINLSKKHSSYNEKQLKTLRYVGKFVNLGKHSKYKILHFINMLYIKTIRYTTLFIGKYLPDSWYSDEPLIPADELKAIRDFYEDDWGKFIEYVKKNNP